jgi:hypothetical protein
MPVHFDMREVEASIARLNEHSRARAEEPGVKGVQARMKIAVASNFLRQMAIEENRCTPGEHVMFALASAVADCCVSHVDSYFDSDAPPEQRARAFNGSLLHLASCLCQAMAGLSADGIVESVDPMPAGRA